MDGRADLEELAEALRELHRRLVEGVRRDCEQERHAVPGAAEFLPFLTTDSRFAWLHLLSELVVDVEAFLMADPSPTEDDCAALRAEMERLITAPAFPETAGVFAREYSRHVARDAQVADAHATLERLVRRLPRAEAVDEASVLHERHGWSEARRHRRPAGR